jgi:flagellar basal body-associated protein FliL
MRRCPKCNRTFQTDTQKFCTHDGGLLFDIDPGLHETVQFDSTKIRDAVAKPTTRDLDAQLPAQFDPEATVVTSAGVGEQTIVSSAPRDDDTVQVSARDTKDLEPQVTQHQIEPPPAAATSGPIAPTLVTPPSGPIAPPPASPTSGPIAPTQTSAPLPPSQPATSGPIGTSAPLEAQPIAQAAPGQPVPPSPAKKKSKAPLILGILAVLLVLGLGVVVAAYFVVVRPMLAKRNAERTIASAPPEPGNPGLPPTTASPTEVSKPAENEPPPYSAPADAVQFVNSKDDVAGKLKENYVDFSFYYPDRWVKVPSTDNFIKVERRLPPDFTQENFAVSPWYPTSGATTFDDDFFRALAEKDSSDFSKKFPEYKKISEGPTKAGAYDGYEFRFEAVSRGTDKGDITLWGREIFFPPRAGEKTGLKFLILTTSLAPELRSASDVGEKGELPMLLESFRFGKK